jgi:hypothetical protein
MPSSDEPPEPNTSSKSGFLAFWTTLPGVLTGAAALITAIVGLATLLHFGEDTNGTSSPPETLASAPSSMTAPGTTSSAETGSSAPQAAGIMKTGRLALRRGDEADLEHGRVGSAPEDDIMFGPESTPYLHASATAFLAPIETPPSKRGCERVLSDRRDPSEVIPNLSTRWVCVSTSEGHVAFVKIVRLPGVGSAQLTLDYVVWQ